MISLSLLLVELLAQHEENCLVLNQMISLFLLQAELLAQHEENCLVLNQMTASVNDLIVFVTGGTAGPA